MQYIFTPGRVGTLPIGTMSGRGYIGGHDGKDRRKAGCMRDY